MSLTSTGSSLGGPQELGQNFLTDRSVINTIVQLANQTSGPIVEIGAGKGALTVPLSQLQRKLTAIELDPRRARGLRQRLPHEVIVVNGDVLTHQLPRESHTVIGNIPFHLTTSVLRRLLAAETWHTAILLTQWEAARRRAGVGGASMLTASWWPWYEFSLHSRVPAHAFRPIPAVDGGLIHIARRDPPLVTQRQAFQRFVAEVFTGRGRGLADILARPGYLSRGAINEWMREHRVAPRALPKDLSARQWAALWQLTPNCGADAPTPRQADPRRRGRSRRRRPRQRRANSPPRS